MIWIFIIPIIFLLIGVCDMPSGYYTFMRIIVFISGLLIGHMCYKENDRINLWTVLFALITVLFNPVVPVYLYDKEAWVVLDLIGAAIFGIKGYTVRKKLI